MYIFICNPSTAMEKTAFTTATTTAIASDYNLPFLPVFAVFINIFLWTINWDDIIAKFVPKFKSFFPSKLVLGDSKPRAQKCLDSAELSLNSEAVFAGNDDECSRREDVEMVMGRLGLFCSGESEELGESFGCDELSRLFEEKEPSLEEVKEAFDVFDENRDGFVDAVELQRVLRLLGLKQRSEIEDCKRMIKTVDHNKDGKIDFHEFVKFMETIFC